MKKRTRTLIACLALVLGMGCVIVGCEKGGDNSGSEENKGLVNNDKYEWGYSPVAVDICDDDMKIDGVLDEARWQDKAYLVHEDDGVVMEYTTAFSEKGLYIGAKVQDDDIQWYVKKAYEQNSSFWLSIKGKDVTYKFNSQEFTLFIDPVCPNMVQMTKYQAAATTNKPMAEHPTEMTAEAFLSWDTLNIELGENGELPEYVLINPHYRHIVESGSSDNAWLRPTLFFDDNDRQQQSGKFGANGYLNADAEDAIMGNAGNGMSKSDGWDVSKEAEGFVRSTSDHSQAIFFKDINSDAYVFETTMKVVKGLGYVNDSVTYLPTEQKKPPSGVGIVNMVDEISLNAFLMNGNDIFNKSSQPRYETLSFYVNGRAGWKSTQLGMTPVIYGDDSTITLTCIKNGGNFYYIVNGSLIYTEYVSYLNEESCPGFFAIDAEVHYTDYWAEDYSDKPQELANVLEAYGCYMISVSSETEGGRLQASIGGVDAGGEVSVSIFPDSGYLLTGFTVNGEDHFDAVMNGMEDGAYTFKNVNTALNIDATFTKITSDLLVYVRGNVKNQDNIVVGNAIVSVDDFAGRYHIETGVSSTGVYRIGLPMTGTFELGGKQFTFDGNYTVSAKADGFHGVGKYIKIEENSEDIRDFDFQIGKVKSSEMQTFTAANGDVYYSPDSGWQNHSVIYLNQDNMTDTAVFKVEVTAEKGIQFAEWGWTGVGITVSNGNKINGSHYFDYGGTKRTVPSNNYYNALFGFETTTSIMAYSGFNMNQNNQINRSVKIPSAENPTMSLTLLLSNDTFYLFVEEQYIAAWAITDALFTPLKKDLNSDHLNNAKFSAGDKFMFGVGAYNLSPLTPVSIRVVEQKYGADATAEMESNQLYKDIFYPSKINVKQNESGEFVMPTGWMTYGYAMTNTTLTDAAVYTVKIKSEEGLMYSDAFYTNVGITFSNGDQFDSPNWYGYNDVERKNKRGSGCINWYAGGTIGIGNSSTLIGNALVLTSGAMSTAHGKSPDTWPRIGTLLNGSLTEKELTVVFYEHNLYVFLEGNFISKVALTDPAFTWVNSDGETKKFNENDKLIFGVSAVNVSNSTPTTVKVMQELYGAEALSEIESNELYQFGINYDEWRDAEPIMSRGATQNADGTYSLSWYSTALGQMAYQYFEGQSDTAVFSVDITMPTSEIYQTNIAPRVGISISNGKLLTANYNSGLAVPGEYQSTQIAFFKADGRQSLCSGIDGYKNIGRDCNSVPGYLIPNGGFSLTKETSNLTVVLYKQKFYAYVDGAFIYSWAVTDGLLSRTFTNNDGKVASTAYSATDKFMFGICANGTVDWTPVFKVVKNLYGEDALAELQTNDEYENVGASVRSKGIVKNTDGSYSAPTGWQSYGYKYTTSTAATTAVYSVKIKGEKGLEGNNFWSPSVGIIVTNGTFIDNQDLSYVDYRNVNRTVEANTYYGTCFSLTNDRNLKMFSGKSMNSLNMTAFANNLMLTTTNTERILTLVLYKDTFYCYIDNTLVQTIEVDNVGFQPAKATASGKTYGYSKGDSFLFGISAHNVSAGFVDPATNAQVEATPITFSEIKELYGNAALTELTTNPIYAAIGATNA